MRIVIFSHSFCLLHLFSILPKSFLLRRKDGSSNEGVVFVLKKKNKLERRRGDGRVKGKEKKIEVIGIHNFSKWKKEDGGRRAKRKKEERKKMLNFNNNKIIKIFFKLKTSVTLGFH